MQETKNWKEVKKLKSEISSCSFNINVPATLVRHNELYYSLENNVDKDDLKNDASIVSWGNCQPVGYLSTSDYAWLQCVAHCVEARATLGVSVRRGPPFHHANSAKLLLYWGMVHHGNAIISSGSPLHKFAQWHKPADRTTWSWGKCRDTQTRKSGGACAFLFSERCTAPPSGRSPPLQPHGQTRLNSLFVFRAVNCSFLVFPYLLLSLKKKRCLHFHQPGSFPSDRRVLYPKDWFFFLPQNPFSLLSCCSETQLRIIAF